MERLKHDTKERFTRQNTNNKLKNLQSENDYAVDQAEFGRSAAEEEGQMETEGGNDPGKGFEPDDATVKESGSQE